MVKILIPSSSPSEQAIRNLKQRSTAWSDFHDCYHSDEFHYSAGNDKFMRRKRNHVRKASQHSMTPRRRLFNPVRHVFHKIKVSSRANKVSPLMAERPSSQAAAGKKNNKTTKKPKLRMPKPSKPTKGNIRDVYAADHWFEHGDEWTTTWDVDIGFDPTAQCLREGEEKLPFGWPMFAIVKV